MYVQSGYVKDKVLEGEDIKSISFGVFSLHNIIDHFVDPFLRLQKRQVSAGDVRIDHFLGSIEVILSHRHELNNEETVSYPIGIPVCRFLFT